MPSSAFKTCARSEEHTSELQSHDNLVCRLLLEKNRQSRPRPSTPPDPSRPLHARHAERRAPRRRRQRRPQRRPHLRRPPKAAGVVFFFSHPPPPNFAPLPPPTPLRS